MDWIWPRTEPEVDPCTWHLSRPHWKRAVNLFFFFFVCAFYWLWYCINLPWKRKENCLANLGGMWQSYWYLYQSQPVTTKSGWWRNENFEKKRMLSWRMTSPVQLKALIMQSSTCLQRNRGHMKQFVLELIRQTVHGVNLWNGSKRYGVLQGDGVVSSWPSAHV